MAISSEQMQMLAEIQALALSAGMQTGRRVMHETQSWPDGVIWSEVHAIDDDCERLHESCVAISPNGGQRATFINGPASLIEQRDALATWILANRKQEAA